MQCKTRALSMRSALMSSSFEVEATCAPLLPFPLLAPLVPPFLPGGASASANACELRPPMGRVSRRADAGETVQSCVKCEEWQCIAVWEGHGAHLCCSTHGAPVRCSAGAAPQALLARQPTAEAAAPQDSVGKGHAPHRSTACEESARTPLYKHVHLHRVPRLLEVLQMFPPRTSTLWPSPESLAGCCQGKGLLRDEGKTPDSGRSPESGVLMIPKLFSLALYSFPPCYLLVGFSFPCTEELCLRLPYKFSPGTAQV